MQINARGGPRRSRGSRRSASGQNPGKPARKLLARLPSGSSPVKVKLENVMQHAATSSSSTSVSLPRLGRAPNSRIGYAGKVCSGLALASTQRRSVFQCFRPDIDAGAPVDRRGSPGTLICTKNQHRRPMLRPFRGHFIFWVPGDGLEIGWLGEDGVPAEGGVRGEDGGLW